MKRFFSILIALCLLSMLSVGLADLPDISSLSFDELVELKDKINLAMWNSEEWQEVTVPIGVWKVGEDIPVRHWSISISPDASGSWASIEYCDLLDASGTDAGNRYDCKIYAYLDVAKPDNDRYPQVIDIDCKPGTYIIIGNASVVFTPYSGKPSLGFK